MTDVEFVCLLEATCKDNNKNDEQIAYALKVWYTQKILCEYQNFDFDDMLFRLQEIHKKWKENNDEQ